MKMNNSDVSGNDATLPVLCAMANAGERILSADEVFVSCSRVSRSRVCDQCSSPTQWRGKEQWPGGGTRTEVQVAQLVVVREEEEEGKEQFRW